MMHKVASNVMLNDWSWIHEAGEVTVHSAVIISCPFSDFGAEHPQMEELLNICDSWNVSKANRYGILWYVSRYRNRLIS